MRLRFYPNGKKIIPSDLDKDITINSIIHWIYDDGTAKFGENGIIICSHGSTELENNNLRKILKDKFNIDSTVRKKKIIFFFTFVKMEQLNFTSCEINLLPQKYSFQ